MSELIFGPDPEWPDDEAPAYKRIARVLREKIARGELPDGAKLPSLAQLGETYGVSEITARAAVNQLRSEGLAVGVRGKGVFARRLDQLERSVPYRYWRGQSGRTYDREAAASGVRPEVEHKTSVTQAPQRVAERLGIDPDDEVVETRYLIRMGGRPVTASVCWEPRAITGGTPIEFPHEGPLANEGIVARFDSIGHHVGRVEEILDVRRPRPDEVRVLDVPADVPVIQIQQTFYAGTENDEPVETADIVYPSDRYRFRYDMEIR